MQYMLLIYDNENHQIAPADRNKMFEEYGAFTHGIIKSGNFQAGAPLQPTSTATTVRVRDGKPLTVDGPFAETKEQLAGFYLIEARDLNNALQVAAKIPAARVGSVEVRPVRTLNLQQQAS